MRNDASTLLSGLKEGEVRSVARAITLVENDHILGREILKTITVNNTPVIGITGPPGAGKSTLVNALLNQFLEKEMRIAIIAVDPSSIFNFGSLLGDRIRMNDYFNHPSIYIRSIASRGSLGGLSEKIIEITELLKASNFDLIIVETVGVGQSEVEISGLADCSVVVLVPESGDQIQLMKAGIIEIADIFVINKCDREASSKLYNYLNEYASPKNIPVFKTSAINNEGISDLAQILMTIKGGHTVEKIHLLFNKCVKLLNSKLLSSDIKKSLFDTLSQELSENRNFNLFSFVEESYNRLK